MTTSVTNERREHQRVPPFRWSSGHLLNQRARLRVLIYTMEHDQNIQPQPWQVESLKKMLGDIEARLQHPTVHSVHA